MKKRMLSGLVLVLLLGSLGLTACGDTDRQSTVLSQDFSPVATVPPNTPAPGGSAGGAPTTAAPASGGAAGGSTGGGGAVAAGVATAGLRVFNASQCGTCHTNGGRVAGIGPKLANTNRDEAYIRNILRNGKGAMPAYNPQQISDTQLGDLVAYIQNLK